MQRKNDAKLARTFGPPKDERPTFKFRCDLVADGLVVTPVFVWACDHDDANAKLAEKMGHYPYALDGRPLQVSS